MTPEIIFLLGFQSDTQTRPRGYKTFFMLNSAEHKFYTAHKYGNGQKLLKFQVVGILTFMSRINFSLS